MTKPLSPPNSTQPRDVETEVTAAMVLEYVIVAPATAEKIATYANHRLRGLLPTDARREAGDKGISLTTGRRYEKALHILCDRLGLPVPPDATVSFRQTPDYATAAVSGRHQRYHAQRGVSSPICPHCTPADPHASRWCPMTCGNDNCSNPCGLLANHGLGPPVQNPLPLTGPRFGPSRRASRAAAPPMRRARRSS